MTSFVVRRVGTFLVMVAVALSLLFFLLHALPGDSTHGLAPTVAANPEAREAVARAQRLDRPLVEQYADHLSGLARGDMGRSFADGSPVWGSVSAALPVSLSLGLLAVVLGVVPGLVLGVVTALKPGRLADATIRVLSLLAVSVPSYWLAVLSLVWVGSRWPDLVPQAGGFVRFSDDPVASLQALLLPALVLALGALGMMARTTRTALVEVLSGDDVRFARAMGMSRYRVVTRVALRNAAPTCVTVLGLVVAGLLSGTVLVENVFQLPGLGQLMVNAFGRQDYPLAMGAATVTAVLFLGLNLVVDVTVAAIDPRQRKPRGMRSARRPSAAAASSPTTATAVVT